MERKGMNSAMKVNRLALNGRFLGCFMFALVSICPTLSQAVGKVYEKPSSFIKRHFGAIPKTQVHTLTSAQQKQLKSILGHKYKQKKVRYWTKGNKLAVILEKVGKSEPITTGFIIKSGKISELKILIYRESHGWEVSRPFFAKQFQGASLKGNKLSKKIDGIVGATLSVRSLTKLSAMALYLSEKLEK